MANTESPSERPSTQIARRETWRSQAADVVAGGVRYRTWCNHRHVAAILFDHTDSELRRVELQAEGRGYFSGIDLEGAAGDRYRYSFGETARWPDPASRWQPNGVHGASAVIDPATFRWSDQQWARSAMRDLVIYELHVGAFTSEGTFLSAIDRLDHLRKLGVTALELMPIGDFPGERNWGYDGVALYAPSRAYGHPDDLRSLVDAAHAHGLAVILDVVYNHFGPDGNYLGAYHPDYFSREHKTPWGDGFNFGEPAVRDFFADNAPYWMREFHIDGFRLDATHAIFDPSEQHIVAQISERVHQAGGFVIAEDERNEPALLRPSEDGGLGVNACWSDDFHHVVRVMLTGDREGYYSNFDGTPAELAETIAHGWLFRGRRQKCGTTRGGECSGLDPEQFVYCISNHDQTGNRAYGERLGHLVSPAAYRAASALLCLLPYTPLLFMGQEWSAGNPFQFFTDHNEELARQVTSGRRREFRDFSAFRDPKLLEEIPDPQARETFLNSKLSWDECDNFTHAATLRLYQDCLALRRNHPALQRRERDNWRVVQVGNGAISVVFHDDRKQPLCAIVTDLIGQNSRTDFAAKLPTPESGTWKELFSSNALQYGGTGEAPFAEPTTLLLCAAGKRGDDDY
ncbi:MAG: malto-oligosyltrehalose trehalohydrolase [Verrucomicrobiota bacterium]|nr:malto-oligosyltrehalose trehalohydrolase [Verrucomicrobiota bacterium]